MVTDPNGNENILDLFLASNQTRLEKVECLLGLSEHDIVTASIQKQKPFRGNYFPRLNGMNTQISNKKELPFYLKVNLYLNSELLSQMLLMHKCMNASLQSICRRRIVTPFDHARDKASNKKARYDVFVLKRRKIQKKETFPISRTRK